MRVFSVVAALCVAVVSAAAQGGPPAAKVVVARVVETNMAQTIDLVGIVEARRRSTVAAQTAGAVMTVQCEDGDVVAAGEVLVQLDDTALMLAFEAARAAKAEAEARYLEQHASRTRAETLFHKGRIAAAAYEAEQHSEEALKQRLAEATTAEQQAEDLLEKADIRAPFAGTVARRHVEKGEWLVQGGPVVDLIEVDPVDVVLALPERHVAGLDREQDVMILGDAVPGRRFRGRIRAVVMDADPRTHTLPVKVSVPNPDGALYAGMFARARVPLATQEAVLLAPKDAIVARGPMNLVFRVTDGVAEQVAVQRGVDFEDRAVVSGDVKVGDLLVVRGNERLFPGQPLEITETQE